MLAVTYSCVLLFALSVLATSYSRLSTTIASAGLNFRVRKENGCDPCDESPGQKEQIFDAVENGVVKSIFLLKNLSTLPRPAVAGLRPCGAAYTRASPSDKAPEQNFQRACTLAHEDDINMNQIEKHTRLSQFLSRVLSGY